MFFKRLIASRVYAPKCISQNSICVHIPPRRFSNKHLSDTSIMVQSGLDIQELPLMVKKLSNQEASNLLFCENTSNDRNSDVLSRVVNSAAGIPRQEEIDEIIAGFKNCNSLQEVFKLLEILPSTFVEPAVAFFIMKKISELDENATLLCNRMGEDVNKNFTTTAVFNQLIGTILSNSCSATLVNCLKLINQRSTFKKYFEPYQQDLFDKILINVTKNAFSIAEICEIVEEFHIFGRTRDIDKLWIGIVENAKAIDATNIMNVFHVLPCLKTSRPTIAKVLCEKFADLWFYVDGQSFIELLEIVRSTHIQSYELMQMLGRWLNTKIHSVNEDQLLSIVKGFSKLDYVNTQIVSALERYVKIRIELIANPAVLAAIMDYCDQFRIRSPLIFEKVCDYFIAKGASLSPTVVKSLIVPYGNLHFAPTRSYEFWKTFEQVVADKFTHFQPDHVIDIMLSCVLLEKYPINFVNYLFNPYFLTRLQMSCENWSVTKNNLVLFDHLMTVECPSYAGPLLPKEFPPVLLSTCTQLKVVRSKVKAALRTKYADIYNIRDSKVLRSCPLNYRCVIDIHMFSMSNSPKYPSLALLIHTPESYTYDGHHLVGMPQLRIRHFTKMGLKIVNLNYFKVVAHCNQLSELKKYLEEEINSVVNQSDSH